MDNSEKVAIFIDGNNFYFGLKRVYEDKKNLINFDFEKFCNYLANKREITEILYYNAPLDISEDLEKYKSQQKFFDKIRRIPKFKLILCKLFRRRIKGTNQYYYVLKEDDIHMAVDIVKGAFKNKYDAAILVSGDGDFLPAVKAVQEENKTVENAYFKKTASLSLKQNCNKSLMLKKEILDNFFNNNHDNPIPKPE
jgi:uncharacterized LabA/DUF88 family protein